MRSPIGAVLALVSLFLAAAPVAAQQRSAVTLTAEFVREGVPFWLRTGWFYAPVRTQADSLPPRNEDAWTPIDPELAGAHRRAPGAHPLPSDGGPSVGWFRLVFEIGRDLDGVPLGVSLYRTLGAAEIRVDGEPLLRAGDPDADPAAPVSRPVAPRTVVLEPGRHEITVRYSLASAEANAERFGRESLGFLVGVERLDTAAEFAPAPVRGEAASLMFFAGLLLALGVIHLVLYLFFPRPAANLYFGLFTILFALQTIAIFRLQFAPTVDEFYAVRAVIVLVTMPLTAIAAGRFLYAIFDVPLRWHFRVLVAAALGAAVLYLVLPGAAWTLAYLLVAPILFWLIADAFRKRKDGAGIIGIGFVVLTLPWVYMALGSLGLLPPITIRYAQFYGVVGLCIAMSVYLARNFARTSHGHERLSAELEESNRMLEQRVAERTTELRRSQVALSEARDAAEAANRTKSQFLANMSHELRTPLNAIMGYSEMLMEDAADAGAEALTPDLAKIHAAGRHLLELINAVLDISKIEAGRMELSLERFDLGTLVSDVATTIAPLVARQGNTLKVELSPEIGSVYTDPLKLKQILLNLLGNASKFTDGGEVALTATREAAGGEEWIVFEVSDTGIGMNPEQLGRLFQPFVQADASVTRRYGGTGLGLTITKRFVEMMGGTIGVRSTPGSGTSFVARVPAEVAEVPRTLPIPAAAARAPAPGAHRGSVLVVDDDPEAQALVRRMLTRDGYRVLSASSGEEGLERARAEVPDLITLDVLMPGMDGWAVLAAIKADPALRHTPVVMMTIVDDHGLGFALGAADYLVKPVERAQLLEVIEHYLGAPGDGDVLVIDDDPHTRELLRRTLAREGWSVREAADGRDGLRRLEERLPGVILLDLIMPEMDGFEMLEALRADARWRDIPVVVVTSKDLTEQDRARLRGGVDRIMQKGTHPREELVAEVARLLRESARAASYAERER